MKFPHRVLFFKKLHQLFLGAVHNIIVSIYIDKRVNYKSICKNRYFVNISWLDIKDDILVDELVTKSVFIDVILWRKNVHTFKDNSY